MDNSADSNSGKKEK